MESPMWYRAERYLEFVKRFYDTKRIKILGQNLIDQAERLVLENIDYDSDPYLSIIMHINGDADIYFGHHLCSLTK